MRILFVILWLTGTISLSAQDRRTKNYLNFANKPYYFGITLGYNSSHLKVFQGDDFAQNDSLVKVVSPRSPGFNLGIVTNLKLGQDFDLRFLPTFSFSDRTLEYTTGTGRTESKRLESVFLEMPFQVRYKSKIYRDFRVFVLASVKYTYDLSSNSRVRQAAQLVKVSPSDFVFEYGGGVQIFFPYFIFSPELKFSYGLGNSLIYDRDLLYSSVLEKVLARGFTLSFHFEG